MKKAFFLLLLSAFAALALPAEIDVRVEVPSREALRELVGAGLMIDDYRASTGEVFGVILETDLKNFTSLGYPVEILPKTDARVLAEMTKEHVGYPLHATYVSFMEQVVADHPVIASLDTVGFSVGGRPILMMKISNRVAWDEAEPEFCYISSMHGDEIVGFMFMQWLIDSLTNNYGSNPRITRLVDSCEIFINPLMNPDGYVAVRRTNNHSVDLNRNFPVPDGTRGDDYWTAEVETQAIVKWFAGRHISYAINFHGGALVANYPWDFDAQLSSDDSLYKALARNYSSRNPPMFASSEFDDGITNGYAWYEADGTLQDYSYWLRGDLHITVELDNDKNPTFSTLPSLWNNNYDACLAAIEVCLDRGVHGTITDSLSGAPIAATITIGTTGRGTYSAPENGYYHRIFLPGAVNLTFSAPGYRPKTRTVTIPATGLARLDVQLVSQNPITLYRTDFEADNGGLTTRSFGSNPQEWAWGAPSLGIVVPFSGQKLWGTVLAGQYSNQSKSRLVLEDIALPDADSIALSFFHWYSFQTPASSALHDGGNMKLWTSSGDSAILSPTPDYDTVMSSSNVFIPGQRAYADTSFAKQWREVRCDLTPWRGQTVDISWDFGSSSNNVQVGWYIDDVWIYYFPDTALVVDEVAILPGACKISASPNPFNATVKIGLENAVSDDLRIFDIRGRLVREIAIEPNINGRCELLWDGTDSSGNGLGSGVYFIASPGNSTKTPIVLMK